MDSTSTAPQLHWLDGTQEHSARWQSEAGLPAPRKVILADDRMPADQAYRLASEGTALLWTGDYHNARQLLSALGRRIDQRAARSTTQRAPAAGITEAFHRQRQAQGQRARILNSVLVPLDASYQVPLRRAPDVHEACTQAWGPARAAVAGTPAIALVTSLRELQGVVGAYEWRRKGVPIAALDASIHPHYGVFSPVRGEYVDLVARAPLPGKVGTAFDLGTGTGVLAAVLARRGIPNVVATDLAPRALDCARENLQRLGLERQVRLEPADLYPDGRADLVVCNPPWLPGKATTTLEQAVYDPDSRMLRGFLAGLAEHLAPGGEGWLILSDLAEHLGLRPRAELLAWIETHGLRVAGKIDTRPLHPRAQDTSDPLHVARSAELTSLWRLVPA